MSYSDLYQFRQTLGNYVKHPVILKAAQRCSGKRAFMGCDPKLKIADARSYYIALDDPKHEKYSFAGEQNMIFFSGENNKCWKRFVVVKEAMHLFDDSFGSTSSDEEFEALLNEWSVQAPEGRSPAMKSEIRAFWMALGLCCPESDRVEYQKRLKRGEMTELEIAQELKMPEQYIPSLLGVSYKKIIDHLITTC